MAAPQPDRIRITLLGREIQHNGTRTEVVFRLGRISVGCTDVDTNAAEFLLAEYRKAFPPTETEVVLQDDHYIAPPNRELERDKQLEVFADAILGIVHDTTSSREWLKGKIIIRLAAAYEAGRASCTD